MAPNTEAAGQQYVLSDYEILRLQRIKRNQERLDALGLGEKYREKLKPHGIKKKKSNNKKKKSPPRIKPGQERRSKRVSGASTKLYELSPDHEDDVAVQQHNDAADDSDTAQEDDYKAEVPVRQVKRLIKVDRTGLKSIADAKNRAALEAGNMDERYLAKFREFLRYHDKISDQNERSVMRQIGKLARGEGIRYESSLYGWEEGRYFMRGRKITPLDDIPDLMEKGQECEKNWGRDHGNGWLLSHPLKKLLLFQQFCLNNPPFLDSKCKLKDYVTGEGQDVEEVHYDEDEAEDEAEDKDEPPAKPATAEQRKTSKASKVNKAVKAKTETAIKAAKKETKVDAAIATKTASEQKATHNKSSTTSPKNKKNEKENKHVGARIAKDFDAGLFFGTITKYYSDTKFWIVEYDDGDDEEYDANELKKALRHYGKHSGEDKKKKSGRGKRGNSTASTTPAKKKRRTARY
mmetsp:Transcript_6122/g.11605  ORF Transcript_6122/g.11605 Transcript_6122/m.11605 type:complete len:463 (-) Transcript_6122:1739-3127(-)